MAAAYVVYWALGIRSALAVRLYRNQALGLALVVVCFESISLFFGPVLAYDLPGLLAGEYSPLIAGWQLSILAFQIAVFYWIDSSVLAARKSDPLLRDTAAWRRLRYILWALLLGFTTVPNVFGITALEGNFTLLGDLLGYGPVLLILGAGVFVLPVAASRAQDPTLRRNLAWFVLFVATLFFDLLSIGQPTSSQEVFRGLSVGYPLDILMTFFLYRSTRSLVPLNRISMDLIGSIPT